MKITQSISVSKERVFQAGSFLTSLVLLAGCKGQQGSDVLQTPSPDANALNQSRQRALDILSQPDQKYLGDPISSFKVNLPAEPDGSKPASTVSGTIFEINANDNSKLEANHLTLGLFVPEKGDVQPVLINHISDDPNTLIQTTVKEDNGATTQRYGIAAMPLDAQYLDAFINGDASINGPVDKFLQHNSSGEVVPLYTILLNDITPDNVKAFVDELSQLKDPAQIQAAVLSHIYGVTFSDLSTDRSIVVKLNSKNQNSIKDFLAKLFFGSDMVAQAKGLSASEMTAQAGTPTVAPTASPEATIVVTPTPVTTEIEGKPYIVTGVYARDASGTLQYTQDTEGNWIKTPPEVKVAIDTGLGSRLGADFALSADGTSINGVSGLKIDKEKGTTTFNFDGKGEETFNTGDIHVVSIDINGQPMKPTLLLAGYAWNPEVNKWEIYNPGFPTSESPKDQLGWFNKEDVANGNWLRWHQRAKMDLAIQGGFIKADGTADVDAFEKDLFKNAYQYAPTEWGTKIVEQNNFTFGDVTDHVKFDQLWWTNDSALPSWSFPNSPDRQLNLKKDQFPVQSGLSFSFLTDSLSGDQNVLISSDVLNDGGKSVVSLPMMASVKVFWTEPRNNDLFNNRLKGAFGLAGKGYNETYVMWPIISVYPNSTSYYFSKEITVLSQTQGDEIKSMIQGGNISPQISLELVGAGLSDPDAITLQP